MTKYDFSNTRCFIDCDGCLADTLTDSGYNKALDNIFMGVLTEHRYCEVYKDFGDAYDIIPGAPWKTILRDLCEYHIGHRLADAAGIPYPTDPETGERCSVEGHPTHMEFDDEYIEALTKRFEDECLKIFSGMDFDDFAIEPVIRFCREYKAAGGTLIIHSGTNEKILNAILDSLGIRDLFDDYLCSDMLDADPDDLGKWGYKTELLSRLLDKYPVNGMRDFVVGDTKGDGFGATEVGLPFILTWRGYPANPSRLSADPEGTAFVEPDAWVDVRQLRIDDPADSCEDVVDKMLEFASVLAERR